MVLNYRVPTPLEYFASLVASDEQFPLLEAAASLAMDEYPELDVQQVPGAMDHLLSRARRRLAGIADPAQRFQALNRFFFGDLGFCGNVNHYHDPENSYLHTVLRTRRGIPVSLAVLWLELATGIGLDAQGVGFPGHFLVRVQLAQGPVFLDPFTGRLPSREDLSERLDAIRPAHKGALAPVSSVDRYLQAVSPRAIVARMLRNLKDIHRTQEDWPRLLAAQDRLIVLLPQAWEEFRDRGLVLAELGEREAAVRDLETYLARAPASPDRRAVQNRLADLRDVGRA